MTDPFATITEGNGDYFKTAEHEGDLCIIKVKEHRQSVTTAVGTSDAIVADIDVVDGDEYPDALLFGTAIVPKLRQYMEQTVLVRIAKGVAKPGKSAPWILVPADAADQAKASAWRDKKKGGALAPF